ncbi:molybdenum cofactor guanylyltransferase MobA [Rhabdaerophilum sp. SD176]|uniref:molybdenum cofactor guanylyltransferase MobA n=1 Tax=Rhabdaerophilum sp. SD176 TaxID=2983548 RepID=UPI0024DFDF0A|nr:molybdenum cofactor guanylyltransferase MobA [Rhabdaerophilum sp. SD176]
MSLAYVILAGGRATRMGGGDKPLKRLGDRAILDRVIDRLAAPAGRLVLNANADPGRFASYSLPVVSDALPDYPGPLAGILAGLDWAVGQDGVTDILSVPGDCPFIPKNLASRLLTGRAGAGTAFACAASDGWTHPVIGLWPISCRDDLRDALVAGERKIDRFTGRYGCAAVEWPHEGYDPFFNVNTPDELLQAEALLPLVEGGQIP